jgi:ATP-dependent DNA ligase
VPVGGDWAFEVKFDGMRLQARCEGRAVCLRSRPGRDCSEEFPELAPIRTALGRHRVLLATTAFRASTRRRWNQRRTDGQKAGLLSQPQQPKRASFRQRRGLLVLVEAVA